MANTIFSQKFTCLALATLGRCQASKADHHSHHLRFNSKIRYNRFSTQDQMGFQNECTRKMNMVVYANINMPPGAPLPSDSSPGHWKVWILGTVVTILLSFSRGRWGPLLQLKEKIETTIDEAERVADIVEEVADDVEKMAEKAVKNLPKGKLHDVAEFVEKVAEDIEKQAQNADDALEKVEDMEKKTVSFFETVHREKITAVTSEAEDQK